MKKNYGITFVQDYPIPGVNFIDINGLLIRPKEFDTVIHMFADTIRYNIKCRDLRNAAILATESRGFLFAAPVAQILKRPLVLIRKHGKIPNNPYQFHITNEYTNYDMEIDGDLLTKFNTYIYIDDILATGNTLVSVRNALRNKGKDIILALHLTAVDELKDVRRKNIILKNIKPQEIIQLQK